VGSRRTRRPSAASAIVPVTTTRSPGLAPLRRIIFPWKTAPRAAIEIVIGPGVRSVSPPSRGNSKNSASSPRPRANGSSHAGPISCGSASASRNPSGRAPLAARSDRFTRNAFLATASAGSSGKGRLFTCSLRQSPPKQGRKWTADFRNWHKCDLPTALGIVRFQG